MYASTFKGRADGCLCFLHPSCMTGSRCLHTETKADIWKMCKFDMFCGRRSSSPMFSAFLSLDGVRVWKAGRILELTYKRSSSNIGLRFVLLGFEVNYDRNLYIGDWWIANGIPFCKPPFWDSVCSE